MHFAVYSDVVSQFQSSSALRSSPELFEIPSQLMEAMMWDPEVIRVLAQPSIPAAVCHSIALQGNMLGSTDTLKSLALAVLDLELHGASPAFITSDRNFSDFQHAAELVSSRFGSRLGGPHRRDQRWWVSHTHMSDYASM
jgi:Zn-dependent oligopeptidase